MPTSVGPNTFGEENLVFGYDLGDVSNSYKGEPTSNVVNDPAPSSAWGISNYNSTSTRSYGVDEDGNPMLIIDVTSVGSGYPRSTGPYLLSTITGAFSTSFEAKAATNGLNIALKIYENGSTKITNTANLTTEWQRFTFDNQSTGFTLDRPYFNPVNNGTYYIRKIQIEAKSHSTPYVAGTRSATQGLIDLTGNSTIDLTNVSFDSSAQVDFDGSSDYVDLGSDLNSIGSNATFEMVFKAEELTDNYRVLLGWGNGSSNYSGIHIGSWTSGYPDESFHVNFDSGTLILYVRKGHTFYKDNTYHHAIVTAGPGSYAIWIDGVEQSVTYGGGNQSTTFDNIIGYNSNIVSEIGRRPYGNGSGYFNGKIPLMKVYDRILTASEIKANYNAIKGRFNI